MLYEPGSTYLGGDKAGVDREAMEKCLRDVQDATATVHLAFGDESPVNRDARDVAKAPLGLRLTFTEASRSAVYLSSVTHTLQDARGDGS